MAGEMLPEALQTFMHAAMVRFPRGNDGWRSTALWGSARAPTVSLLLDRLAMKCM